MHLVFTRENFIIYKLVHTSKLKFTFMINMKTTSASNRVTTQFFSRLGADFFFSSLCLTIQGHPCVHRKLDDNFRTKCAAVKPCSDLGRKLLKVERSKKVAPNLKRLSIHEKPAFLKLRHISYISDISGR